MPSKAIEVEALSTVYTKGDVSVESSENRMVLKRNGSFKATIYFESDASDEFKQKLAFMLIANHCHFK